MSTRTGRALLATAVALALAAPTAGAEYPPSPANASGVPIPPGQVDAAVGQLDGLAGDLMHRAGVPGMAIAVIHDDAVVYAKGFGVREVGKAAPVDADTVFQLASMSKSISASVVARAVSDRKAAWDEPASHLDRRFVLSNPFATRSVTVADLFAHRSGLPEHVGDVLEDLGLNATQIVRRLRYVPLTAVRQDYAYTNFGLSAGAYAVAHKIGTDWASLADRTLYTPLGMAATSSRHADFVRRADRATPHVQRADGTWMVGRVRDADAQAPAGGVSSSVRDLAQWMRMMLGGGAVGGRRVIGPSALREMLTPVIPLGAPPTPDSRTNMGGLGIDVITDATGRVRYQHSGAFTSGTSTSYMLLPAENLGIVVLTNGWPVGLPESVTSSFMDLVEQGRLTFDWLSLAGPRFVATRQSTSRLANRPRPSAPRRAHRTAFYAGTYRNNFYGRVRVGAHQGRLTLAIGPKPRRFALSHWNADTWSMHWIGTDDYGVSAVDFTRGRGGRAGALTIELLDDRGLGTFRRVG